jgi:hypothetical protein
MKRLWLNGTKASIASAAMLAALLINAATLGKTDVPVFLLSGQSNMSGQQNSVSDLSADQKKTVENVMINLNTEGDNAKLGKWLKLGPGFGFSSTNMGPELFFGRTLSDSMPGKKIALIKDARSGTYLGESTQWLPPSSNNGKGVPYYAAMMNNIKNALKSFNSAFDTSQYTPRWAGFVWLQGENDALDKTHADAYETNLTSLIKDIRDTLHLAELPIILPMIAVQTRWPYNSTVRAADVACKTKLKNVDTMDTKGLPSNGVHFSALGEVTIGTISAQRWLTMHYNYGLVVPIAYHYSQSTSQQRLQIAPLSPITLFDLSGRKTCIVNSAFESALNRSHVNNGVFIAATNKAGVSQYYKKVTIIY